MKELPASLSECARSWFRASQGQEEAIVSTWNIAEKRQLSSTFYYASQKSGRQ